MGDLTTVENVQRQIAINSVVNGTLVFNESLDDTLLEYYVTQSSKLIESVCKRSFSDSIGTLALDAGEPHVFGRTLFFDTDVLGVASITNGDGTAITPSQYRLLPPNDSPKYGLELLPSASVRFQPTPAGDRQGAITVVGTLGYCAAADRPADITLFATKLAAHLYMTRDNDGGVVQAANGSTSIPVEMPSFVLKGLRLSGYVKDTLYA